MTLADQSALNSSSPFRQYVHRSKSIPGALTSVTNFATSVSRNMERLSLDSEHRERQEEWRRKKPAGLGDGFKQGLTGFGLSMLGMLYTYLFNPLTICFR